MKIILLEKIEKLGTPGKIIAVKNGYAKNYLIPQKKALIANKENIFLQEEKIKNKKNKDDLNITAKLKSTTIIISVTAKNNDDLYITYNTQKIIKILKKLNINIKQKAITKDIIIKKLGTYEIEVKIQTKELIKIYLIFKK
ncbi:MAG TPA: 50S ribosomal protein L9 [Candidatus Azoamicus sp.]